MKVWSMDIKLCATAYVRADTEEEALKLLTENFGQSCDGELPQGTGDNVEVSGAHFDSDDLPVVSLSPAVTFYGAWTPGDTPNLQHDPDDQNGNADEEGGQ